MKYMVTGATGFIGNKLAKRLIERGHEVNAIVRDLNKAQGLNEIGANLFKGDITEKSTLYNPMKGVDGIFHIAAWYRIGAKDKSKAEKINVDGTRNVLKMMKELSIPKGVYTSSVAVFSNTNERMVSEDYQFKGKHISEYDRTKWKAHYEVALPLMREELPLIIVQPGVVYGPGDTHQSGRMLDKYMKKELPMLPKKTAWCWSHVDDIAEGHILAMERGRKGESYIIAGEKHTLIDALRIAKRITGIEPPGISVYPWILKVFSKVMVPINAVYSVPEIYHPEALRVSAGVTYLGSNDKARRDLGYSPMTLEEGFKKYLPKRMNELSINI